MNFKKPKYTSETIYAIYCKASWTDGYNNNPWSKMIEAHMTLEAAGKRLPDLQTEYNCIRTAYDRNAVFYIEEVELYT